MITEMPQILSETIWATRYNDLLSRGQILASVLGAPEGHATVDVEARTKALDERFGGYELMSGGLAVIPIHGIIVKFESAVRDWLVG